MTVKMIDQRWMRWYNASSHEKWFYLREQLIFIKHDKGSVKLRLGDIAMVRSGLVLSRKKAKEKTEVTYRLLNLRSIKPEGYIEIEELDLYDAAEELPPEYVSHSGDVIIRLTAPYTAVLIDQSTENLVVSSNFVIIRVKKEIVLPEYLHWLLNTSGMKHAIYESATSNMLSAVNTKFFTQLQLDPISIADQQKIAQIQQLAQRESQLLMQLAKEKEKYYAAVIQKFQKEQRGSI